MEESDASVSTLLLLDGTTTEASGSGYAAGGSSGYEDEHVSLASNDSCQSDPSSKRTKVMASGNQKKPTGKFRTSWKLPEHITASKRGKTYPYCKLCVSDFNIVHGGMNDIKRHVEGPKHQAS